MRNDVHVVGTVLSVDQLNMPGILAVNAASAALAVSDIPWNGPIGAVRIGYVNGEFIVNPTEKELPESISHLSAMSFGLSTAKYIIADVFPVFFTYFCAYFIPVVLELLIIMLFLKQFSSNLNNKRLLMVK